MEITYNYSGGVLTVRLEGELDEHTATSVRKSLDKLIDGFSFSVFVIDFSGVTFMDSTGIGVILGRYKRLKNIGANFACKNTNKQVDKVMEASGLYGILQKI